MVTPHDDHGRRGEAGSDSERLFDAIVIGSGFAGAVTACRLAEAELSVCVLERGRRYGSEDFPRYPVDELFASSSNDGAGGPIPDFSRWLWGDDRGLFDICDLGDAIAVQAAGYGGGSLIYASVHLRPPYEIFDHEWPIDYRGRNLETYFDLAARMLGATPIPHTLAKTTQLFRAGMKTESAFRLPLAVYFGDDTSADEAILNESGRPQRACDMRGRCCLGCDRQAKNTLDLNYLARAEDAGCHVLTLAEATRITKEGGVFTVSYRDLLVPTRSGASAPSQAQGRNADVQQHVRGKNVFLCAGAVNTTRLLFACDDLWNLTAASKAARVVLGTRYFPNSDSLAAVLSCDEPHEADYGPTITAALLYDQPSTDLFEWTLDFYDGRATQMPRAGMLMGLGGQAPFAQLVHDPVLDSESWDDDGPNSGVLMLSPYRDAAPPTGLDADAKLIFLRAEDSNNKKDENAALAGGPLRQHRHWLLVQDGGYPPDVEPLLGLFASPLWLGRNRYREAPHVDAKRGGDSGAFPRRAVSGQLRLKTVVDALGATSSGAMIPRQLAARMLNSVPPPLPLTTSTATSTVPSAGIIAEQLGHMLPSFFVQALAAERNELITRGVAGALPLLAGLLDDLAASVVRQIDPSVRRLVGQDFDEAQLVILARGLIRQVLQVLAGSEVAVADKATRTLLDALPDSPTKLVDLLANLLLWAIGYNSVTGNSAILLTMGRDTLRGRLEFDGMRLKARLPSRLADRASAIHESVLRDIAAHRWHGELRTNPGWTTLGRRVTVHSQGGCPMGDNRKGVTDPTGQVHGIDGLYVMDAAAFPASVGANPSATVAAIAEYKVATFIEAKCPQAHTAEAQAASEWVDQQGRRDIDPLNASPPIPSYSVPELKSIGLAFKESLEGWCVEVDARSLGTPEPLADVPHDLWAFRAAEETGLSRGNEPVMLNLVVRTRDLARLVAADPAFEPVALTVGGFVTFDGIGYKIDRRLSTLHLFVGEGERKFFRYALHARREGVTFTLHGVKVLHDDTGFDVWHDTSTVYFESTGPRVPRRGILRVSLNTFLTVQMRTMKVTGTTDPARQSWALLAFYKYFATKLTSIYLKRADEIKRAMFELMTSIHV